MNISRATLYLTRNGLLEPLGQSQVMGYLKGLSQNYRVTVVSHERVGDLSQKDRVNALRLECQQLGINWIALVFNPSPRFIAPIISLLRMVRLGLRCVKSEPTSLIHARSYLPSLAALIISRVTGVPFIFDMRALWPEELITSGRIRRGSLLHLLILEIEHVCLKRASVVVTLTNAAVGYLKASYPKSFDLDRTVVIPTCADLRRFVPQSKRPKDMIVGCLGTVLSGWFRIDLLGSFFKAIANEDQTVIFKITTRDDPIFIRKVIDAQGEIGDRLSIESCPSDRVHEVLQGQSVSVMFYAEGELSELGRSPTRLGEILGSGVPVIANHGIGDVAEIIQKHRVGVLASGSSSEEMLSTWRAFLILLSDPNLSYRCRQVAEQIYSLDAGTKAYENIYNKLAENSRASSVMVK